MNPYTVVVTTKRSFKVIAENEQKAMGKVYQLLMQFRQDDVQPVGDLALTMEAENEKF